MVELMMDQCRDLDVLWNIIIMFSFGDSELFDADINEFLSVITFATAENIETVIVLATMLELLMSINQSRLSILK